MNPHAGAGVLRVAGVGAALIMRLRSWRGELALSSPSAQDIGRRVPEPDRLTLAQRMPGGVLAARAVGRPRYTTLVSGGFRPHASLPAGFLRVALVRVIEAWLYYVAIIRCSSASARMVRRVAVIRSYLRVSGFGRAARIPAVLTAMIRLLGFPSWLGERSRTWGLGRSTRSR